MTFTTPPLPFWMHCEFCGKLCGNLELWVGKINEITWHLCDFCVMFATVETANQVLNNIHPNNIEEAWGAVIAQEWIEDAIDYI
jgi:hypothetical protein